MEVLKLKIKTIIFVVVIIFLNRIYVMAEDFIEEAEFVRYFDVPPSHITKFINVPYLDQKDIISGCEAVSATMLLQSYAHYVSKHTFTNDYLIKKDWYENMESNEIFGPDPNSAYVGNPYIESGDNCGFGCYSNAIAKSINNFFDANKINNQRAIAINGLQLSSLIENYILNDIPILIWATMDMKPSKLTMSWTVNYADENSPYKIGDKYTWIGREHCLVLVGFDYYRYYFNDPYKAHGIIGYDRNIVEKRFNELGKMALIILNN